MPSKGRGVIPALEARVRSSVPSVLFVDDEPQARAAFLRLAKSRGLKAETAATGAEAIALAQGEPYDIVVTDVCMPGMGGAQLLQHLMPLLPAARFVVVSGAPVSEFAVDPSTERRVLSFLRKPWDNEQLVQTIVHASSEGATRPLSTPPEQERALRVLVIEDDVDHFELLQVRLRRGRGVHHHLDHVSTLADARQRLGDANGYDVVVTDLGLPDSRDLETVILLRAAAPATPIVVLTAGDDDSLAMRALRVGAQDFLRKGAISGGSLTRALYYAVERGRIERRMLEMARADPLTGLGNRMLFRERVALALARARRSEQVLAVLYLDLDRFKRINDQLGHDVGDAFLQEVGRRLLDNVREYDTVARFGGDEFAVLLEGLQGKRDVAVLVERLLAELRRPVQLYDTCVSSSASIGVALFPACGTTDELLEAADTALYQSKRAGKDRFCFFGVEMQEATRRRLQLETELGQAAQTREFRLVYQKQVDISGGLLVGVEALLRWQRQGETLDPDQFVPALEESGLIVEVGSWVLCESLRQLGEWRRLGVPIPRVAVNVSPRQFTNPGFVAKVNDSLSQYGIDPSHLELEITEAVLLSDMAAAKSTALELHDLGVRLAIDDFGTGYSSLKYLLELPIDVLKIDRSFVRGLEHGDRHGPIVRAVLDLARSLNIEVVAEGLEDEHQRQMLIELGCRFAQGFLFHRPVEAGALTSDLASGVA